MSRASPPPRRGDARLAVARIATVRGQAPRIRPCLGPGPSAAGVVRSCEGTIDGWDFNSLGPPNRARADRFKQSPLRCRFRRRAGERDSVTPRITPASENFKVRSNTKRPSSHLLSPRSEPTSRDRATRTDARVFTRRRPFCRVPFFPGGCPLLTPASNARQVTRDAPRSSGFPQRDTYARDDAPRAAREPFAR